MERMEPCWRHRDGCRLRHRVPGDGIQGRQPLGTTGCMPLPLWDAGQLCRLHYLPYPSSPLEMEGAAAQMGPCRHLLAHRRLVLTTYFGGSAYTRLLGMESLYLRMDLRNSGYHREFHQTERALQCRDVLLRGYGVKCPVLLSSLSLTPYQPPQ